MYIFCLFKTTLANEEEEEGTVPNVESFALT